MRVDNIEILRDTLKLLEKGEYWYGDKKVRLKLSRQEMEQAMVFLPEDIRQIGKASGLTGSAANCVCLCENTDSFTLARKRTAQFLSADRTEKTKPVLVLNLANPVNPGGGVRRGAKAQEEDLCRKSSLLVSLESENAARYYRYNRTLGTYMGSHAVVIHPQVEILKDENGQLLPETVIVSVMTCAAPMLCDGMEGLTQEQYEKMVFDRITGMLKVAASQGYRHLVLGAFGCGAFQNDARVVSDLFCRAMKEFNLGGLNIDDLFSTIDFAVLDRSLSQYNYRHFARNFDHFRRQKNGEGVQDRIRGCLFGGAVGDALGLPVEFLRENELFSHYGQAGITAYEKNSRTKQTQISDDTQMSLFTANGLLVGVTASARYGEPCKPRVFVFRAYQDWLKTQESSFRKVEGYKRCTDEGGWSWLLDVPELYSRRAPGMTCLSALEEGTEYEDYVLAKRNNSKGCGGVMRVAPMALVSGGLDPDSQDMEGAQLAAITHGHSLGYMTAVVLVHILRRIVYPKNGSNDSLKEIVLEAEETAERLFKGDPHLGELKEIITRAVILSENGADDLSNIHELGEGWVAEETLAIAIYCALRHQDDFSAGVIAAVNHKGDSDSTGAVTGNILGALHGYSSIADQWKTDLELSDVILEMADDLTKASVNGNSAFTEAKWQEKYCAMRRPAQK